MTEPAEQLVPDLLNVVVPAGARVVVMSDLHFGQNADQSSEIVAADLARLVDSLDGPGGGGLGGEAFGLPRGAWCSAATSSSCSPRATTIRDGRCGRTHGWPLHSATSLMAMVAASSCC